MDMNLSLHTAKTFKDAKVFTVEVKHPTKLETVTVVGSGKSQIT